MDVKLGNWGQQNDRCISAQVFAKDPKHQVARKCHYRRSIEESRDKTDQRGREEKVENDWLHVEARPRQ